MIHHRHLAALRSSIKTISVNAYELFTFELTARIKNNVLSHETQSWKPLNTFVLVFFFYCNIALCKLVISLGLPLCVFHLMLSPAGFLLTFSLYLVLLFQHRSLLIYSLWQKEKKKKRPDEFAFFLRFVKRFRWERNQHRDDGKK